jgi:hypothetical protein
MTMITATIMAMPTMTMLHQPQHRFAASRCRWR